MTRPATEIVDTSKPACRTCGGKGYGHFPLNGMEGGDHVPCPDCKSKAAKAMKIDTSIMRTIKPCPTCPGPRKAIISASAGQCYACAQRAKEEHHA